MVRPYTRAVMPAVVPNRAVVARPILARREAVDERNQRQRERNRNLWRAALATAVLLVALSSGFLAGANSNVVTSLFSSKPRLANQPSLETAHVKASELRTARVLFTQPDGESCRPVYFDNVTGEMSPGTGMVPCTSDPNHRDQGGKRFGWRNN